MGKVGAAQAGFGIVGWVSRLEPVEHGEVELPGAQLPQRGGWVELLELEIDARARVCEVGDGGGKEGRPGGVEAGESQPADVAARQRDKVSLDRCGLCDQRLGMGEHDLARRGETDWTA